MKRLALGLMILLMACTNDRASEEIFLETVDSFYAAVNSGDQAEWHKTKNVHVWKKQANGSWRLHVDIWNSTPE